VRDLVKSILASRIVAITCVSPAGSRAANAGTYIALASHIAAMALATNIGSSTPMSLSPLPTQPWESKPLPDAVSDANTANPPTDVQVIQGVRRFQVERKLSQRLFGVFEEMPFAGQPTDDVARRFDAGSL